MKKFLSLALVAVMLLSALSLVACGPTPGPNGPGNNDGSVPKGTYELPEGLEFDVNTPVSIKFYSTMGQTLQPIAQYYIDKFNEIYPNIEVDHSQPGNYDTVRDTIKTELTVGEQPNLAYCYPDHVAMYNRSGKVVTLDQFINHPTYGLTEAQVADFVPGFYAEGKQFGDNFMYTLPFSKSTEVLYYNKTFFDANGLTPPTTWDEMEKLCEKIKALKPESTPLGYDSEANWFITMCEQYKSPYTSATGDKFLFNNETNQAFVKRFAEWYSKGYVTTQELQGAYTSTLFVEEKSFMSIGSSAGAVHQRPAANEDGPGGYAFEVGIVPIPQVDPSNPKVISQGPSVCIFDTGNDQEILATWLFVRYLLTSADFQAAFSNESGYVPVLKSASKVDWYAENLQNANGGKNIAYLSAKICMEQADAYYTSPAFNGSSTARDQVGFLIQAAMTKYTAAAESGTVDQMIDDVFEDAINECENML